MLIIFSSCCSKKELFTYEKPIAYKLLKQQRIFYKEKKISFWREEWIKHTKNIDSTHFIYQNFETFYIFTPNKIVKRLELRNHSTKNLLRTYRSQNGDIGTYNSCFLKIGSEKLIIEKKGLDTIFLIDEVQNIENVLIRITDHKEDSFRFKN